MPLGFIATVPVVSSSLNPLTGITPFGVVQLIRWLGGTRRTADLVPGVSFPGYDAAGNPIDYENIYQYADLVQQVPLELIQEAIQAGVMLVEKESNMEYPVYRLILQTAPGRVDTGATYPGCTREQPDLCYALQFATVQEAFSFAAGHNEIPRIVQSADEAFNLAEEEERSRLLQTQYTGPSASPMPIPTNGSVVGSPLQSAVSPYGPLALGVLALLFVAKKFR